MIEALVGQGGLPWTLMEQIAQRGEGVPLYIEELALSVLQDAREAKRIPSRLRDPLMARLDGLGPAKETVQLAALLGRSFSLELLSAISPLDGPGLDATVASLVSAGLLLHQREGARPRLVFKHALLRDAAEESMSTKARSRAHALIARARLWLRLALGSAGAATIFAPAFV